MIDTANRRGDLCGTLQPHEYLQKEATMEQVRLYRCTRSWMCAFLMIAAGGLAACNGDEEADDEFGSETPVPEVAEVRAEGGEVRLEDALPLTDDDIGRVIVATGEVVGTPLPVGFFMVLPTMDVIFVETAEQVQSGERVRVMGALDKATAAVFNGWRVDALENHILEEWTITDLWFIEATSITRVP